MTTDQATQKHFVRMQLENMWKRYADKLRLEDHELVILAVPTYPANIEAVSALDLSDINDLMAVFAKHREDHPDELHPIEPSTDPALEQARETIDSRRRDIENIFGGAQLRPEQVGQGHDGAGASQERAEPPAEQDEGDAAADTMEQPIFELIKASSMAGIDDHIRIYANGRVEGWDGTVINRIPQVPQLVMPAMSPEELLDLEREYTRSPGNITWVRDAKAVQDLMAQVPRPPIETHIYRPVDEQAQGACSVCGHGRDVPWHSEE